MNVLPADKFVPKELHIRELSFLVWSQPWRPLPKLRSCRHQVKSVYNLMDFGDLSLRSPPSHNPIVSKT
jgi:hypothetical protein